MYRSFRIALPALLAIAVLFGAASAAAAPRSQALDGPRRDTIQPSVLGDPAWTSPEPGAALMVVIEMSGPTALDLYTDTPHTVGDATPDAEAALDLAYQAVAARQAPVRARIEGLGAEVISTYDTVANAFLVRATRAQVEALDGAPGVARIHRAPEHHPALDKAVPTIGADRVIEALGYDGTGVNVAIIDTGIDYTHASFGGAGSASAYRANNPNFIEPGSFPTAKVVGGHDFVGTAYTGGNTPFPDPDPLDEHYHGTHVGGIAAGIDGVPRVPHGVAPGANLIALKVFGRNGGTNVANDAVEWCAEANLGRNVPGTGARCDVINMSLGSSWASGVNGYLGVMRRATEAGIVVLASAGNSGDVAYITGAPAAALHSLSIASTFAGGARVDKIQASYGGATQDIEAEEADSAFAPQMASVGTLQAPLAWLGRACTGDASESDVSGAIALISYGGCTSKEVIDRAEAEGAVGALLYNDREELFTVGSDAGGFGDTVNLPAYGIRLSDGQALRDRVVGGQAVEVLFSESFKDSVAADGLGDTISPFSSRGPSRRGDFKPEIAAPGSNITAPQAGSGAGPLTISGTSMASPMVAGEAALVIQRLRDIGLLPEGQPAQPALSPDGIGALDVAAMLVNYTDTVWAGGSQPVPLARGGSGRIDALGATRGETIVSAGTIASINLGRLQFDSDIKEFEPQPFRIRNLSDAPKRYRVETRFLMADDRDAGVAYKVDRSEVEVPAHDYEALNLLAEATAAEMKPYGAYGGGNVMNRLGGVTDAEYDAHVVVTEIGEDGAPLPDGDVASLPIYMLPRATAYVTAERNPVLVDPDTGQGAVAFDNASQTPGVAELFALLAVDEDDNAGPQMNIEHVGARVVNDPQGNRVVELAIQTQFARDLPLLSSFKVYIDANLDGRHEQVLFNDDLFFFLSGGGTAEGAQRMLRMDVANLQPLQLRNTVFSFANLPFVEFAEVTLDSRQIILRTYAAVLGFEPGEPVVFDAIVTHQANFPEILGSSRYDRFDSVPNGGLVADEETGVLSLTGESLRFDERAVPYTLDKSRVDVSRGGESFAVLTRREVPEGAEPLDDILAVYTQNLPGRDDVEVLTIEEGVVEVPTYTPTPEATPTGIPITPGTPIAETPTPGTGGEGAIYLPLVLRDADVRAR